MGQGGAYGGDKGRGGPARGALGRMWYIRTPSGGARWGALGRVGAHVVCPHTATVTAAYIQSSSVALSLTEGG